MKRGRAFYVSLFFFGILIFLSAFAIANHKIEIGSLLIKVTMNSGDGVVEKDFILSSASGGRFSISVDGLSGVELSKDSISLRQGEKSNASLRFSGKDAKEGVYVGSVIVEGEGEKVTLPIIFEVESKDVFFDANVDIPPHYSEIPAGSKMIADVKIFDLVSGATQKGLGPTPVILEYKVFSLDGTPLSSETESVVVNGQAQLTKTISFPKDVNEGTYVFAVVLKYKESTTSSTNLFRIVTPVSETGSFLKSLDWTFILILGVIVLFFFGLLFVFMYLVQDRDKLFLELRRYNELELTRQQQLLVAQEELAKKKSPEKKEEIEKEINKKIKRLKEKHTKREQEFKKLKKDGNVNGMKKRLEQWKRGGYNTFALESKLGSLSTDDMRKIMSKWKREYSAKNTEGYKNKKK